MKVNLDSEPIETPCSGCGEKLSSTIGEVKLVHQLTCRACGTVTTFDTTKLDQAVAQAQKALDDIDKLLVSKTIRINL